MKVQAQQSESDVQSLLCVAVVQPLSVFTPVCFDHVQRILAVATIGFASLHPSGVAGNLLVAGNLEGDADARGTVEQRQQTCC